MYTAKVIGKFSAAHRLREYQGNCEQLHGHNYKVEIAVGADVLDQLGLVMDFRDLKQGLNSVLDSLDHSYLNELEYFQEKNPSTENIANYIYSRIAESIPPPLGLIEVVVWEDDTSCVAYSE
ncbi:MAG: 6-carboxytetrahydropterin synthase QueD [Deltaproteobacteria bacterium]|nr:6-carboxytetrahydropterin synthase QueD [Deltaproteobacteria bacterium]